MDQPLFTRFSTLRRAARLRRFLTHVVAPALAARRIAPLQCRFEALLGEPSAAARTLVYDWFFYKQLESRSWAGTFEQGRAVLLDAQRVGAYVRHANRGIVIATLHMGDYLEGLRQLRIAAAVERTVFVIRRRQWSDAEQRAFAHIGADTSLTVLRRGNAAAAAIRELRRGAIVVVLFDLPARYGRTVAVDFFDRRANFVRGPAELAVLGRADVLPLLCHYDADGVAVTNALPVIPAADVVGAGRPVRVEVITQRLCTLAEAHIRRYPSQWAHWPLVDELFAVMPE